MHDNDNLIWIEGHVPSLKNSKVKTSRGIFSSKSVKKYLADLGIQRYSSSRKEVVGYKTKPNIFERDIVPQILELLKDKEAPYEIGFHFVRKSRHSFDFNNANQLIADIMVAHNCLEDDNMDYFIPYAFKINDRFYSYNKENSGVWIKIN